MAVGQQYPEQYTIPQLARTFHQFPHLNVSLHYVSSEFNPHSEIYLESLGILGSIPAALLILTLLILLVYLVTRCCDRKPRHRRSIALLKCFLAVLALLCCGAVAVGLYGNDDVHNGIDQLVTAAKSIDGSVMAVRNQTETIELTLKRKVQNDLTALRDQFDEPTENRKSLQSLLSALEFLQQNTSVAISRSLDIRKQLSGIGLGYAINLTEKIEQLRWPVTMAVLSALLILCVVLLVGVARHSRCALITFSVFGLFAVITSWLMGSLYLASSVALGDLCMSPEAYILKATPNLPPEVLSYYTHCDNVYSNPFTKQLGDTKRAFDNMRKNLEQVKQYANEVFKNNQFQPRFSSLFTDINNVDKLLTSLTAFLDCKPLHKHYIIATKSLCHFGLFGLTLMLLSAVGAGFLFTILVWVDSHTWIYIRKRNDYCQVNEHDPYLPAPQASQAIAARTLRGQGSGGLNGSGIAGDHHKPSQHNQQTSSRADHRAGLGDQPGQYATLSKQCKTLEPNDFY